MAETVICAEGLGKSYRIGEREPYLLLRDVLARSFTAPWHRFQGRGSRRNFRKHIWALKDVSFELRQGDVVGIIGRNGAGKTTLLKILSRVTKPTEGNAELRGRVGSLLEIGTAFHPELTGGENIYLNGAILGMGKKEIQGKFDSIVAFAEVEKFVDTPLKYFSSGMYVRLAFSVASHVEPDILLVDEVLAVGDADFQRKCLKRMSGLGAGGWTVLLVSHNMAIIKAIAHTVIWLEKGRIREIGPARKVVDQYLASTGDGSCSGVFDSSYVEANRVRGPSYLNEVVVRSIRLKNSAGLVTGTFSEGSDVRIELTLQCSAKIRNLHFRAPITTPEGLLVFECLPGMKSVDLLPGTYKATICFNLSPLLPGFYCGEIILSTKLPQDRVLSAFQFEIIPEPSQDEDSYALLYYPSSDSASTRSEMGIIRVPSHWDEVDEVTAVGDR